MAASLDPRSEVEAPVRRALDGLIVRSAVYFWAAVLAVLLTVEAAEGPLHSIGHFFLPALTVLVLATRTLSVLLQSDKVPTDTAWARAREMAPRDTAMASLVTAAVPFAWFVGGAAILFRHVDHHDLATVVCVVAPLGATLWVITTLAWIHDCRDRLARALLESDRRFRRYWGDLPSSA